MLAVSLVLFNNGSSSVALSDLDIELLRQVGTSATTSASPPAKGAAGADSYFVASILSETGGTLTTLVFEDPRIALADAGYPWHGRNRFIIPLPSGADSLRIESWDTGQVLIDLDLRGQLQLLCIDRPCLAVCQSSAVDAAVAPAVDAGGVADIAGAADGESDDPGSGALLDAGVSDHGP
jgi:hypothetical protein